MNRYPSECARGFWSQAWPFRRILSTEPGQVHSAVSLLVGYHFGYKSVSDPERGVLYDPIPDFNEEALRVDSLEERPEMTQWKKCRIHIRNMAS
jgi:hypothetical protein